MTNEVFISLRPEMEKLIIQRKKTYEFRKYAPRQEIKKFWIYVSAPESALKYIAEIGELIKYPSRIHEDGVGNAEFNRGLKKSRYAFPILHLDELTKPLGLQQLKEEFGFTPPQRFMYVDKHPGIVEHVSSSGLRRLF